MKPILSCDRQIIYIGEVDTEAKKHWYRHAKATLFPVRWGEPFGMVLIESMACGTPIIAFGEGAVPEIVTHGTTGFVVASPADMVAAVALVERIDRRACRAEVAARFSVERMSGRYAALYRSLARNRLNRSAQPYLQSSRDARSRCRRVLRSDEAMPKDIPVGNGNLLVTFDLHYRIRDVYYPWVGQENHGRRERVSLRHLGGRPLLLDGAGVGHRPPLPR